MSSDPAVVAAERIYDIVFQLGGFTTLMQTDLAQIIREAYAPTLAAKDAEVAGWLRTSQVQDERIDELRAERERLSAEVERLQRELAAAHDESAKRGSEILDLQQENSELRRDAERHRAGRSIARSLYGISEDAFDKSSDAAIDAVLKKETT